MAKASKVGGLIAPNSGQFCGKLRQCKNSFRDLKLKKPWAKFVYLEFDFRLFLSLLLDLDLDFFESFVFEVSLSPSPHRSYLP